jgi:hypothetical protein
VPAAPEVTGDGTGRAFAAARESFAETVSWLASSSAEQTTHAALEDELDARGRELTRRLYQDHLELRAAREERRPAVAGADGVARSRAEAGHTRGLTTVFGPVTVSRIAYRAPGAGNLSPADAALNLPVEKHSHGLRKLAAIEASRGSFDGASQAIERATGTRLGKRQLEELASKAAVDFEAFYSQHQPAAGEAGAEEALVLSYDGKGVVMRRQALRETTGKAAAASSTKLATRLSKGEKRNRKRLAELGAVYDTAPAPRTPADILPSSQQHQAARAGPRAVGKWLTASVTSDAATVITRVFDEAGRRDPDHQRRWVVLLDGNNHQIARTHAEAAARGLEVAIVVDFVHVLEYVWTAAWSFYDEADPAAEDWVRDRASAILAGRARHVAAGLHRAATRRRLSRSRRAGADACANYLTNKVPYLDYPHALAAGWPVATGVIEGACRHLVKDRMDITGARWCLTSAEAILKLRALASNDDFDDYWAFHLRQEHHRVHETRYANP